MYSNKNESDLSTPFCTFNSGTLYSFIRAGNTVKGEHVSATMAIATVVHTLKYKLLYGVEVLIIIFINAKLHSYKDDNSTHTYIQTNVDKNTLKFSKKYIIFSGFL